MTTERPKRGEFQSSFRIPVTHWESLVSEKIQLTEEFIDFCRGVRFAFDDLPPTFRLYTLPSRFKDVDERQPLDEASYSLLLGTLLDPHVEHPLLYVWSGDSASPQKLPETNTKKVGGSSRGSSKSSGGSTSSKVTRANAMQRKQIDNYTCVLCGFSGQGGLTKFMECCHVYEIAAHKRLNDSDRERKLASLGLKTVNDLQNMITLCKDCHDRFDAHETCIHQDLRWVICSMIRRTQSSSKKDFGDLHSQPVEFVDPTYKPPRAVLDERMTYFREKHPTHHYCHLCSEVYGEQSQLDSHAQECLGAVVPLSSLKIGGQPDNVLKATARI